MDFSSQIIPERAGQVLLAARLVLAGVDALHFSADILLSDAVRAKLDHEKEYAQSPELATKAHCIEWLGAQVQPHGSRGGYTYLLGTDDFSIKVLGKGIPHRPGLYVELRSHFLHTHPEGCTWRLRGGTVLAARATAL